MPLQHKVLRDVQESDLLAIIEDRVREGKTIEFKRQLSIATSDEKKEFLKDITSFANSSGGDIIYGMEEDDAIASGLSGLEIESFDIESTRLQQIINNGVSPRLDGVGIHPVNLTSGRIALIVRIPCSWNRPHMVTFNDDYRFYVRTQSNKTMMDVFDIRSAFRSTEDVADRIHRFRMQRITNITAEETPIPLEPNPKVVIHIIPLTSVSATENIDMAQFRTNYSDLVPLMGYSVGEHRYNLDGFLTYEAGIRYFQLFRNGIVESVDAYKLRKETIPSLDIDKGIIEFVSRTIGKLSILGIQRPYILTATMLKVKGKYMGVDTWKYDIEDWKPIDRDNVVTQEVIIDDPDQDPTVIVRPILTDIWNAAGWPTDIYYDSDGNWKGK